MPYKLSFFFLLLALFSTNIDAQSTANTDLWLTQIDQAKAQAKVGNKAIVLLFSGSDWCRPCMAMKQRILDKAVFTDYAKENLVLMEVDFPRKSANKLSKAQHQHNSALAEKYTPKYFPTLVLINAEGKEIDRIGYQSSLSADDYVKFIKHRTAR